MIEASFTKQVCGSRDLTVNLACLIVIWFTASFGYFLISYQLKYIRGDIFVNNHVSCLSEIAAYITSGLIMKKIGLKFTLMLSFFLSFLGMFALIFYQ